MGVGARKKGYIKNKNTGVVKSFLYNPETYSDSRATIFSEIGSPGSSYPSFQYVKGGARNLTLDLFLTDTKNGTLKSYLDFLEGFLPKRGNKFSKPPILVFAMGKDVRECIVSQLDRSFEEFNSNLDPTKVMVTLTLIEL